MVPLSARAAWILPFESTQVPPSCQIVASGAGAAGRRAERSSSLNARLGVARTRSAFGPHGSMHRKSLSCL